MLAVENDKTLVDEGADAVQRVAKLISATAHLLGGGQRPATREHGEAAEELHLVRLEQVVTPCHGVSDCALAQRQIKRAANEQLEAILELIAHRGQGQVLDAG